MAGRPAHDRATPGSRPVSRAWICCLVAATVAAAVAGCGSKGAGQAGTGQSGPAVARSGSPKPSAATAPALAAGQQGSHQQVPWAQVGPGWILAEWSPTLTGSATSLFLIDPAGGRYLIDTFPASPAGTAPASLAYWSGDGQRALLTSGGPNLTVIVLNLRTLATTQFELTDADTVGFTVPDGLAILINANVSERGQETLERLSLTGQLEQSYPLSFSQGAAYNGSALESSDGTELAVGTCHVVVAPACAAALTGVELINNAGQPLRFLPVIPSMSGCSPLRWWAPQELLVSCIPDGANAGQDWLVPTSGPTPTALTASPPAPGDLGDGNAWQLPSGTYVQVAGACSYTYAAKLQPDGLTAPLAIPGVASGESTIILGAQGDRLAIRNVPGPSTICAHGPSLLWFALATNTVTPLLGGTVNGGYALAAVLFGQP